MGWVSAVRGLGRTVLGITRLSVVHSERRLRSAGASSTQTRTQTPTQTRSRSRSQQDHGGGRGAGVSVDFERTQEAFRSKDSLELLRSLVVFKLCSYDLLVDKNKEIMELGRMLLGQKAFEQLMKMTFYGQFVAGEDHSAIRPLLQKNQAFGVGSVLDYSVEEDLGSAGNRDMGSSASAAEEARGVGRARYFHSDESKCDLHMETFLKCIKASGGGSMEGFSAIKMTALGRPQLLLQFSEVLLKWRRFFSFLAAQQGQDDSPASEQKLDLRRLQEFLSSLGAEGHVHGWFTERKQEDSGTVDVLDWDGLLDDPAGTRAMLLVPDVQRGQLVPLLEKLTEEDEKQMERMLQRMDVLAQHAEQHGVRLMVDAEQSYFQPAISRLALQTQRRFNQRRAVIFNTYQCYLKEAFDNVTVDVERSRREGWCFGAKLVRGAYMHQERERAKELGYEDPVNPDYGSTNRMYHRCLDFVLDDIAARSKAHVMVASHNEDSVKHTLRRMNELGLVPAENKVSFGQLLGMCDQISFPLGQAGFPVYKYVPYGPVSEVMPYLSRRAQENRGFMKGARRERDLLWRELRRRLSSGELFHRPAW